MSLDFLEKNSQNNFDKYRFSNFESGGSEPSTPDDLKTAESKDDQPLDNKSFYSPTDSKKNKKGIGKKLIQFAKKNKTATYGGGGIGAVILIVIIIVFIFAQQLPGFAALLAASNMATDNELFQRDTTELTAEKAELDAESAVNKTSIEADYSDGANSEAGDILTNLESYNPNQTFGNLNASNTLDLKYSGAQLQTVAIDGNPPTTVPKYSPKVWEGTNDSTAAFSSNTAELSQLETQIGSLNEDGGIIIRSGVAGTEINALGDGALAGIDDTKFVDQTSEQSDILLDEKAQSAIDPAALTGTSPVLSETDALNSAEQKVATDEATDATSTPAIKNIIKDNGVDPVVETDITSGLKSLQSVFSGASSQLYLLAVMGCVIYDGSLVNTNLNAATTINNQDTEAEKTYLFTETNADKEKAGDLNAETIGALNRKYEGTNNLSRSNPELSANGETVNTYTNTVSPQADSGAEYTLTGTLFGGSLASILDPFLNWACPILTNPVVGVILLLFEKLKGPALLAAIAADAASAGVATPAVATIEAAEGAEVAATAAAEGATEEAAATAGALGGVAEGSLEGGVGNVASDIGEDLATNSITQDTTATAADEITQSGFSDYLSKLGDKWTAYSNGNGLKGALWTATKNNAVKIAKIAGIVGLTYGLTAKAKEIVEQTANTTYNGYSMGKDLANQGDVGGRVLSAEICQKQYFCTPLGATDVTYNKGVKVAYLANQNSHKSTYERYLALSNPYSLFSRISTTTYADISNFSLSSLFKKVASVFNPTKIITGIFSLFRGSKIYAASDTPPADVADESDYGVVQWGYTQAENALANPKTGQVSYQPLQNAKILDAQTIDSMPASQYIKNTYDMCFTDNMGTLLTTKPTGNVATGVNYIDRNSYGNVIGGLCSEQYLGPNSADPNLKAGQKDLIFRWRLDQSYKQSLDMLTNIQNANN